MIGSHHKDFAEHYEAYIRSYISLADSKATWIFSLSSGVILFFANSTGDNSGKSIIALNNIDKIGSLALLMLAICSALSFLVILPRLSSQSKESIIFFNSVALRHNAQRYIDDVENYSSEDLIKARLGHLYDVSHVCRSKYVLLRYAMYCGSSGLALLALKLITK